MNKLFKKSTAITMALSIALSPHASLAQSFSDEEMTRLRELVNLSAINDTLSERLDKLEAQALADRASLQAMTVELDASKASVVALSQALASVEAIGKSTAEQLETAKQSTQELLDDGFKELLEDTLGTIKEGNWVEGMKDGEILDQLKDTREAAEALKEKFLEQQKRFSGVLKSVCGDSPVTAAIASQLAPYVSGAVPEQWTPNLAATAKQNDISLPSCFSTPDESGRTPQTELEEYIENQQASQEMATAMNSMLMAAMATANPWVIGAAIAIMAIMALFSDDGGSGGDGGDAGEGGAEGEGGDSSQTGDGQQTASGQAVGAGQGSGTSESTNGTSDSAEGSSGETEAQTQGSGNSGESDSASGAPPVLDLGVPPPANAYQNVVEGLDTYVEISNQTITFTDANDPGVLPWVVTWKTDMPEAEFDFYELDDDVQITAASAKAKTVSVNLTIEECPGKRFTFDLMENPDEPGTLKFVDAPDGDPCV